LQFRSIPRTLGKSAQGFRPAALRFQAFMRVAEAMLENCSV
jgi:hypothetical protein